MVVSHIATPAISATTGGQDGCLLLTSWEGCPACNAAGDTRGPQVLLCSTGGVRVVEQGARLWPQPAVRPLGLRAATFEQGRQQP